MNFERTTILTNEWRSQIDPPYHREGKIYYINY